MNKRISRLLRRPLVSRQALRVGYLPTAEAAPLLVAQLQGFFAAEHLDVQLQKQTSWLKCAERLAAGELDAAQLPGTFPLVFHLGMHGRSAPLRTACVLSLGGSSFALATALLQQMPDQSTAPVELATVLRDLRELIARRKAEGAGKLRFAVTDLFSNGSYDLRYCLASAGIDPLMDVNLVAITPARILGSLRAGNYDGAWLDEPYGSIAAAEGLVQLCFSKHAFWNHSQGKVLAVREEFVRHSAQRHRALLRAVIAAAAWAADEADECRRLLSSDRGLDLDPALLRALDQGIPTLAGQCREDLVLAGGAANFPWYSQAVWYLGQMIRWGDYRDVLDFKKTAQTVFLPRLYREAARELGLPQPSIGYKTEGEHAGPWMLEEASQSFLMGADQFFDGKVYRPRQTMKYLNDLQISHIAAPLDAMWAIR